MSTETTTKKYEEIHFVDSTKLVWNYSLFTEEDISNFQQGTHYSLYRLFGNKQLTVLDTRGTYFAVWAPNATYISVIVRSFMGKKTINGFYYMGNFF